MARSGTALGGSFGAADAGYGFVLLVSTSGRKLEAGQRDRAVVRTRTLRPARRLDLPVQDPLDGAPVPAARGGNAAPVQPVSDLAERRAVRLHRQDEGEQIGRPLGRLGRLRGVALGAAVELAAQVGWIAQ